MASSAYVVSAISYSFNSKFWAVQNPGAYLGRARGDNGGMYVASSGLSVEIARTAARMVVEDGVELGRAKRRAAQQLGAAPRTPLPDTALVEEAIREHIALFCADTQPGELRALRELALLWMERLQAFRPYVGGAVWSGTATRHVDIYLQLFCDDPKSAEIALIDQGVAYDASTVQGLHGRPVEALSVATFSEALGERVGVHLLVYDHDDLRGALRPGEGGRTPRGDAAALRKLLLEHPE